MPEVADFQAFWPPPAEVVTPQALLPLSSTQQHTYRRCDPETSCNIGNGANRRQSRGKHHVAALESCTSCSHSVAIPPRAATAAPHLPASNTLRDVFGGLAALRCHGAACHVAAADTNILIVTCARAARHGLLTRYACIHVALGKITNPTTTSESARLRQRKRQRPPASPAISSKRAIRYLPQSPHP